MSDERNCILPIEPPGIRRPEALLPFSFDLLSMFFVSFVGGSLAKLKDVYLELTEVIVAW